MDAHAVGGERGFQTSGMFWEFELEELFSNHRKILAITECRDDDDDGDG